MLGMFNGCSSLQSLDLSGWNTANVIDMGRMFSGCSSLQSLDLSGWNTANVIDMDHMFSGCSSFQSLDLSSWNTAKVKYMNLMFYGCSSLAAIYVGEGRSTSLVTESDDMFFGCTSLVGGMNTHFDAGYIDKTYARIDRGVNTPGYFTGKFAPLVASATILGETKYVTTFYQKNYAYRLPAGALAYTASLDGDKVVFHRIGGKSDMIPANTAVVIIADASAVSGGRISLTELDSAIDVTAHDGNILQGSDVPVAAPEGQIDGKTAYVLGKDTDGKLGFFPFSGFWIPAGKAYYVVQ